MRWLFLFLLAFFASLVIITPPLVVRNRRYHIDHHEPMDNSWYKSVMFISNRLTNGSSCYVCSIWPHGVPESSILVPHPAYITDVFAVLQDETVGRNRAAWMSYFPALNVTSTFVYRDPSTFSNVTNATLSRGVMSHRYGDSTPNAPLCFYRPRFDEDTFLGNATNCKVIVRVGNNDSLNNATGRNVYGTTYSGCLVTFNLTTLSPIVNFSLEEGANSSLVSNTAPCGWGYTCPQSMVWTCGHKSYMYLPPGWSGCCHLSYLLSSVQVFKTFASHHATQTDLQRQRRGQRISDFKGILGTIFPSYGAANVAHRLNEVTFELENLTALVDGIVQTVSPELSALRAMALQNRMALDLVMAEKGGVCQLIGEHCCTWIPDGTNNLTSLHSHLVALQKRMQDQTDTGVGFNLWKWLTGGSWFSVAVKVLTPILLVLALLFLFVVCCIPCFQVLIRRLVSGMVRDTLYTEHGEVYVRLLVGGDNSDISDNTEDAAV